MNLYLENGFVDIAAIVKTGIPFIFIWGGRGTGKTYGMLDYVVENDIRFMLMRRTQTQLDLISKPEFSPFKSVNRDRGRNVEIKSISKYNGGVYDGEQLHGYTCALTTIANIRGFDGSDVDILIYDEFIPEAHSRPIKEECSAFLNAYETINRNRELQGRKPLQVVCLANSNDLGNPLFMGLHLVTKAEKMNRTGQEYSIDKKRGIMLVNLCKSEISNMKQNTALYRMTGNTEFSRMSLSNEFIGENERGRIGSRPLKEYNPVCVVGELCIYRHKSENIYYCSSHVSGSPPVYGVGDVELTRFKRVYMWLWYAYLDRKVDFEERICEFLLTKYFS